MTTRELEILSLLAAGRADKEIARALHLHEFTVQLHLRHILRKLNVGNRVEAVKATARLLATTHRQGQR
ncbi:MAG TPA: LuxR C-terminal-related transcriptional regulator [Stellaceae bacterium]|nr:LuxR C-terminal-related transcriptional regulator [Stellaceae bacterium]